MKKKWWAASKNGAIILHCHFSKVFFLAFQKFLVLISYKCEIVFFYFQFFYETFRQNFLIMGNFINRKKYCIFNTISHFSRPVFLRCQKYLRQIFRFWSSSISVFVYQNIFLLKNPEKWVLLLGWQKKWRARIPEHDIANAINYSTPKGSRMNIKFSPIWAHTK